MRISVAFSAVLFFILSCQCLSAQIVPKADIIEYKDGHFYNEGVKIEKQDLQKYLSPEELKAFELARKNRVTGLVCTPVGAVAMAGGAVLMAGGFLYKGAAQKGGSEIPGEVAILGPFEIGLGAVLAAGGIACTCAGIVYLCRGEKQFKVLASTHNGKSQRLTLSPSLNGVGLAINF